MKAQGTLSFPRWSECAPEPCSFPTVEIGDEYQDPAGLLLTGMEVMLPCENCGAKPMEYLTWMDEAILELERALKANSEHKNIMLYHWSPARNRNGITRRGLIPHRRPVTHSKELGDWRAPYICFATDPIWGYALSADMPHTPDGEWDLWATWWEHLDSPEILASEEGDGIHEVRNYGRVYKRHLKFLGSRFK